MRVEIMEWKAEFQNKTYRHKVYANISDTDIKQLPMEYEVTCLDTGNTKTFSELRSVIDDVVDLRPSFKLMQQLREGMK